MKHLIKTIVLTIFCLFMTNEIRAQLPACPPDNVQDCGPWISSTANGSNPHYGVNLSVPYLYRDCNGRIEIKVDWTQITGSGNLNTLTDDAKRDLLSEAMIEQVPSSSIPQCTEPYANCANALEVSIGFESKCSHTSTCTYEVKTNSTETCCNSDFGWRPTFLQSGKEFIKITRTKECGTKCCRLVYKICNIISYDVIKEQIVVYRKVCQSGPTTSTYPGSVCSGSDGEPDCETGAAQPCNSGCARP